MDSVRLQRLESSIKQQVSLLLTRGQIKDPRILGESLWVSKIAASRDLSFCRIYISSFHKDAQSEKIVRALNHASGYIQSRLNLKTKNTPKLRFFPDHSLEESFEINRLIDKAVRDE